MDITMNIPVPTYLKKFLQKQFGESYKVSQKDWFGVMLIFMLERKSSLHYYLKKEDFPLENYSVRISANSALRNGCHIIKQNQNQLVKAIDDIFRKHLYDAVLVANENYGIDYKTAILNTLDHYNITEDDLPYETIRKSFNRFRLKVLDSR